MKQLLIVKSIAGNYDAGDLSSLVDGELAMFDLVDGSQPDLIQEEQTPLRNFGLALGRPNNSPAIVIPEVDIKTLTTSYVQYDAGHLWTGEITIPDTADGCTYTLILVKKGTVPHERNTWTATETVFDAEKVDAEALAAKLGAYFQRMVDSGSIDMTVTVTGAKIEFASTNQAEDWELKCGDDLYGTEVTVMHKEDAVGDKAYIENLAKQCAAGKGFTDVYRDGDTIYPGYPEIVGEDDHFDIMTLRFAVGRAASKTRDERVYQLVHIAFPVSANFKDKYDAMFKENYDRLYTYE